MKFCPECGAKTEGFRFCPNCGCKLPADDTAPAAESAVTFGDTAFDWSDLSNAGTQRTEELNALAEEAALNVFEWEKHQNGRYAILALKNKAELVVNIPANVEAIGPGAFEGSDIMQITMPEGLLKIGDRAFADCAELDSIVFPESLRVIGEEAFAGCYNLDVVPPARARIGKDAFRDTGYARNLAAQEETHQCKIAEEAQRREAEQGAKWLQEHCTVEGTVLMEYDGEEEHITIPNGITEINEDAFDYIDTLISIRIPASVTAIGEGAFFDCENLERIIVDSDNENYCSDQRGVLFSRDKTALIAAPRMLSGRYTIPGGVTHIENEAFHGCADLSEVTIPDSVVSIEEYAFYCCDELKRINIPGNVAHIGASAFEACKNLSHITIPGSVYGIGDDAFRSCSSLTDVMLSEGIVRIGSDAFYNCSSLTGINIPNSVKYIEAYAFAKCTSLTSIEIPDSVTEIASNILDDCPKLTDVTFPDHYNEKLYNSGYFSDLRLLKLQDYKDSRKLYHDIFGFRVQVFAINNSWDDNATNLTFISRTKPVIFHFKAICGDNNEQTGILIKYTTPDGVIKEYSFGSGHHNGYVGTFGWGEAINCQTGTLSLEFYDEWENLLGASSVLITE